MAELYWHDTATDGIRGGAADKSTRQLPGNTVYLGVKRAFDIVLAGSGLLILTPLIPFVTLLIRLDSRGPVLFSQTRIGEQGREFRCWKLRSMYVDAETRRQALQDSNQMQGGVLFKMKQDPRVTRVGRFIRKASIDELPQLWNVLVGDMTLVGPRPAIPEEVAQYSSHERGRLAVKPGLTCLWQISGRSDLRFEQQVALDIEYTRRRSLLLDIDILLRTVPAVLFARGAY